MTPVGPGCLLLEGLFSVGLRGTTLACGSEGERGSMDWVMGRGNASCNLKIIRLTDDLRSIESDLVEEIISPDEIQSSAKFS